MTREFGRVLRKAPREGVLCQRVCVRVRVGRSVVDGCVVDVVFAVVVAFERVVGRGQHF